MNKFSKLIYILFIVFAITSCEKFLEGTNVNPNDPTSVSPQALLTPAQLTLAYEYNANFSRWSGIFVQQVEGVARQQAGFNIIPLRAQILKLIGQICMLMFCKILT